MGCFMVGYIKLLLKIGFDEPGADTMTDDYFIIYHFKIVNWGCLQQTIWKISKNELVMRKHQLKLNSLKFVFLVSCKVILLSF